MPRDLLQRHIDNVNRWRDHYSPLRGLTMARAISMLDAGQRGELADLQWTYRVIERRNPTCHALVKHRSAAVLKLDWDIRIVDDTKIPPGSQTLADRQQKTLREAYETIDNLRQALRFLTLAEFRGYSHLQKHRDKKTGAVTHLEPIDQWCWVRDGLFGPWRYNQASRQVGYTGLASDPLANIVQAQPDDWIIRECDMPIDEIALICYLRKSLSQKDWDAFIEIYGIPSGVVTMPPNIPPDQVDDYETAAGQIAEGGSGALPNGATYTPNDSPRGVNPFRDHIQYQDQELVLAGTGGKLTMLAESGSGTLAGGAHQSTFNEIAEAEAQEISETFQRHLDKQILAAAYPGAPILAYWQLASSDTDVNEIITHAATLSTAGYAIDPAELSEKSGYTINTRDLSAPSDPSDMANPSAPSDPALPSTGPITSDVQATALNGAQVTALADLAEKVATGMLPVDTALAIATAAFPLVPPATITQIFGALRKFTPAAPPVKSVPSVPSVPSLPNRAATALGVPETWLAPIADILTGIERTARDRTLTDADLAAFLENATRRLPELFDRMDHAALASVLEDAMGDAALAGLRTALNKPGVSATTPATSDAPAPPLQPAADQIRT